jgi:uncharacterized protein (UPF0264 family)
LTKTMPAGNPGRPLFLASVVSAAEATAALAAGAEIIDCKNPSAGALGALPGETVRAIVKTVAGRVPVSATVGDLPPDPQLLCAAATAMAATGVDLIKVGVFDGGEPEAAIAALGRTDLGRVRLVGLLLADRDPDFGLVAVMGKAGFAGAMLDTATKDGRSLADVMPRHEIDRFITSARASGLFVGLAGALRAEHIRNLGDLTPDLMGFRGALCAGKMREGPLEEAAARAIATALASLGRRSAARHAILEAAP